MDALYDCEEDEVDQSGLDLSYEPDEWSAPFRSRLETGEGAGGALSEHLLETSAVCKLIEVNWEEFAPVIEPPPPDDAAFISELGIDPFAFALADEREIAGASHAELFQDLEDVMIDCNVSGWDGYGAEAVSIEAYDLAKRFIRSLPADIPRPILSADTDGCVTFEWHVSPHRLVLVSVHPNYRIDYAAHFGSSEDCDYGTKPFFERWPPGLYDLVLRVFED